MIKDATGTTTITTTLTTTTITTMTTTFNNNNNNKNKRLKKHLTHFVKSVYFRIYLSDIRTSPDTKSLTLGPQIVLKNER